MHPNLLSHAADGMLHPAFAQQEETVLAAPPSPVKPAITIAVAVAEPILEYKAGYIR